MKITIAFVLFTAFLAVSEASPRGRRPRPRPRPKSTTTARVSNSSVVSTSVVASASVSATSTISALVTVTSALSSSVFEVSVPTSTATEVETSTTPPDSEETPPPPESSLPPVLGNVGGGRGGSGGGVNPLLLLKDNVQDGSDKTGQEVNQNDGQVPSLTDAANHINFCTGKQKINGIQGRTPGSGPFCNGIPMGDIPDRNNMVSSIITFPTFGSTIGVGEAFDVTIKMRGLTAGFFTNPDLTYYAAPQQLDNGGNIQGHTHVTIQLLDALDTKNVPDPNKFDFFKGVNDAGDGNGNLKASVSNGLAVAGVYRVCTMASAGNHQPVLMPVAQRGAQDDCVRFTVGDKK